MIQFVKHGYHVIPFCVTLPWEIITFYPFEGEFVIGVFWIKTWMRVYDEMRSSKRSVQRFDLKVEFGCLHWNCGNVVNAKYILVGNGIDRGNSDLEI